MLLSVVGAGLSCHMFCLITSCQMSCEQSIVYEFVGNVTIELVSMYMGSNCVEIMQHKP